jgi:3-deoxy-manno-octulosonate cytidylyltransferase (CMP-KDO synthetase)
MRVLGVIPARLGSTRLPRKPLQLLEKKPLIFRLVERLRELRVVEDGLINDLVVATDSQSVREEAEKTGVCTLMTDESHQTGTERVAEVAARPEYADYEIILNIQGDEPFLSRKALEGALQQVQRGDRHIGTAAAPLTSAEAEDPARVKVVMDAEGRALYFSRAVIPHLYSTEAGDLKEKLYWQHVGIYACTRAALVQWVNSGLTQPVIEQAERLEQLRALYYGLAIGVARLDEPEQPGVDTEDDLRRAQEHWDKRKRQVQ